MTCRPMVSLWRRCAKDGRLPNETELAEVASSPSAVRSAGTAGPDARTFRMSPTASTTAPASAATPINRKSFEPVGNVEADPGAESFFDGSLVSEDFCRLSKTTPLCGREWGTKEALSHEERAGASTCPLHQTCCCRRATAGRRVTDYSPSTQSPGSERVASAVLIPA